jgi:trk system potassium uptake protein
LVDFRPVLFVNGVLLLILAAAMAIPAALDVLSADSDWVVFVIAGLATAFAGGVLALGARPPQGRWRLQTRQAFLLTVSAWVVTALCAALPFIFSELKMSPIDALFEAMSGLTTTGATVIVGLDHAPRGILIWRALLNWLGGFGIIVMTVAILPSLRIGGMQLFLMETSDKNDRVRPRMVKVATAIGLLYGALTLASAVAFWLAGMAPFDALCHGMAALSTGGFSTSDASLARWGAAVQWVAVVSMLVGGSPLPLLIGPGRRTLLSDTQLRDYLTLLGSAAAALALWHWAGSDATLMDSLRQAAFGVISVATTTGFVAGDFGAWGGFAQVLFFMLAFVGGCTGSTAGGVKMFRWRLLFSLTHLHIKRLLHPHGVFILDYNRRPVSDAVVSSVLAFVVVYFVTFALFTLLLTATGLDLVTALSGSAAALGNVGHGLGDAIGAWGGWWALPSTAKGLLTAEMLVGRLELFTVFVVFTPGFWRE